jgi:hypothetical protein
MGKEGYIAYFVRARLLHLNTSIHVKFPQTPKGILAVYECIRQGYGSKVATVLFDIPQIAC